MGGETHHYTLYAQNFCLFGPCYQWPWPQMSQLDLWPSVSPLNPRPCALPTTRTATMNHRLLSPSRFLSPKVLIFNMRRRPIWTWKHRCHVEGGCWVTCGEAAMGRLKKVGPIDQPIVGGRGAIDWADSRFLTSKCTGWIDGLNPEGDVKNERNGPKVFCSPTLYDIIWREKGFGLMSFNFFMFSLITLRWCRLGKFRRTFQDN